MQILHKTAPSSKQVACPESIFLRSYHIPPQTGKAILLPIPRHTATLPVSSNTDLFYSRSEWGIEVSVGDYAVKKARVDVPCLTDLRL